MKVNGETSEVDGNNKAFKIQPWIKSAVMITELLDSCIQIFGVNGWWLWLWLWLYLVSPREGRPRTAAIHHQYESRAVSS
jgi:hypothetical protein